MKRRTVKKRPSQTKRSRRRVRTVKRKKTSRNLRGGTEEEDAPKTYVRSKFMGETNYSKRIQEANKNKKKMVARKDALIIEISKIDDTIKYYEELMTTSVFLEAKKQSLMEEVQEKQRALAELTRQASEAARSAVIRK